MCFIESKIEKRKGWKRNSRILVFGRCRAPKHLISTSLVFYFKREHTFASSKLIKILLGAHYAIIPLSYTRSVFFYLFNGRWSIPSGSVSDLFSVTPFFLIFAVFSCSCANFGSWLHTRRELSSAPPVELLSSSTVQANPTPRNRWIGTRLAWKRKYSVLPTGWLSGIGLVRGILFAGEEPVSMYVVVWKELSNRRI